MGALGYNKDFSEILIQNIGWVIIFLGFLIILMVTSAFNSGRSYEANSVGVLLSGTQNECAIEAARIQAYTGIDLTSDLKLKECNSIHWLSKKIHIGFVWVDSFE